MAEVGSVGRWQTWNGLDFEGDPVGVDIIPYQRWGATTFADAIVVEDAEGRIVPLSWRGAIELGAALLRAADVLEAREREEEAGG